MDEQFQIPVQYKGKDYLFNAQLHATTYQYRIEVLVNEIPFYFERDDEGNFRGIIANPDNTGNHKINPELLQAVADTILTILS